MPQRMHQRHPRFVSPGDRARSAARDPFVLRVSLLVAAVVLMIPLALIFRPGDGRGVESSALPGAAAVLEPSASPASASPLTPVAAEPVSSTAATTTVPTTSAPLPVAAPTAAEVASAAAPAPTVATTAAKATTTAAPVCNSTYTVRAGDYWLGIARAHSVTLDALLGQNGATVEAALFPGESVCLPAGAQAPTTSRVPATTRPTPTTPRPPATTRAPATTAAPAPPARTYSRDEVISIIRFVWPDDLEDKALAIAERESNFVPTANNYCCYGLFQIYWSVHQRWLWNMGVSSASQLYDPATNAAAAFALYQRSGGWGPWGG